MTVALVIRPEAEVDLAEAADYYASVGHAAGFEGHVHTALQRIAGGPQRYPVIYQEVRRALVRRYPYAIFYVLEGECAIVLAIRHQRQDPARWPQP